MNLLIELLQEPLLLLFIILFLGLWLGQIKVKGLSLGSAGVLLIAMVFGHFGYEVSSIVQNLGLSLFIVSVGLQAGPRFFRMIRSNGVVFGLISVLIIVIAGITTILVAKLFHLSPALSVGLMTGALTSTPGLAAALQATNDPLASVGYGIAYPFGVLAVVLFVQIVPRLLKVDLKQELQWTNKTAKSDKSPEVTTFEVLNPIMHKQTIKELPFPKGDSIVISRVIRGERSIVALSDTVLLERDRLVVVGIRSELDQLGEYIGREVATRFDNLDHIKPRRIAVESNEIVGSNIQDLQLRRNYGVTVTRIERGGIELSQNPRIPLEYGDVLTVVSNDKRLDDVEKLFLKRKLPVTNIHLMSLSMILLLGILLGMAPIHLPNLGTITLGVAGGPLFAALIISHFGKIGPIQARYFLPSNKVIGDIGLVLFLAGAGTTAGSGLVEVVRNEGINLFIGGAIITVVPMIVGYFLARKVLRLKMIHTLGALCGGMTSTPGLGAVNQLVDSEEPAIAYAAAYPFALVLMAVAAQLLVFFI